MANYKRDGKVHLLGSTMSSCNDPSWMDQSSSAPMRADLTDNSTERHLPGKFTKLGFASPDNACIASTFTLPRERSDPTNYNAKGTPFLGYYKTAGYSHIYMVRTVA